MIKPESTASVTATNPTPPTVATTTAWKLATSETGPVPLNTFAAECVAELNWQTPLSYQLQNRVANLLPPEAWRAGFKTDPLTLPAMRELLNAVTLPEEHEMRVMLYQA